MKKILFLSLISVISFNANAVAGGVVGGNPSGRTVKPLPKNACNSNNNCYADGGYSCNFKKPIKVNGKKYKGTCTRPWEK